MNEEELKQEADEYFSGEMTGYTMTLNGAPVKIARSEEFKVELSPKQKKEFEAMRTRKDASGTFSFTLDPYTNFKEKMKEQIKLK